MGYALFCGRVSVSLLESAGCALFRKNMGSRGAVGRPLVSTREPLLFSCTYKLLFPQLFCFCIHTNDGGGSAERAKRLGCGQDLGVG